ncbi:MAG: amidohydrolase family protein [Chthoniobacterales bacterium]
MIIDIHTHPRWHEGKMMQHPRPEEGDAMLEKAGRLGICKLCLLGCFYAYPNEAGIQAINDATIGLVQRHPGEIFGLCFLNPMLPEKFLIKEIERCLEAGLSGVKLEFEVNARDARLDPIMEFLAARDAFLLHHAWYKSVHKVPQESDPSDIAHLAKRHPNTKILMAHLTAGGMRGVLDIKHHANVSVDTSGSPAVAGMVEYAVRHLGAERVLFGSDFPIRDFACQLGRIQGAKLKEQDRELILWRNAARLLKISSEDVT